MTNQQYIFTQMRKTFGFSIACDSRGDYYVSECPDISCDECVLHDRCNHKGISEWLNEDFDGEIKENSIKSYEAGIKEGREQVFNELSQIFKRKEVSE